MILLLVLIAIHLTVGYTVQLILTPVSQHQRLAKHRRAWKTEPPKAASAPLPPVDDMQDIHVRYSDQPRDPKCTWIAYLATPYPAFLGRTQAVQATIPFFLAASLNANGAQCTDLTAYATAGCRRNTVP
ncbi:hypothetical protein IWZ01DRAFT_333217 [Phyllosticta capitalensis]